MTSNLGSDLLLDQVTNDGQISTSTHDAVMKLAQSHFKPEFLNRIDDIIMFTPLNLTAIEQIVDKFIGLLSDRLADQEITLTINGAAKEWLAKNGYEPAYGARPLQRFITDQVETPLAKQIIGGKILPHSTVEITLDENHALSFQTTAQN